MAIANPQIMSVIPSLAQCKLASDFSNALKEIFVTYRELNTIAPKLDDFEHQGETMLEFPHASYLFLHDYLDLIQKSLRSMGMSSWESLSACSGFHEGLYDPVVRRMVIEDAFASSATRGVEFEPVESSVEMKIDCFRIFKIEEPEVIAETVPYYRDEEELGKSIFEAEVKKFVCNALTTLVMDSVSDAPLQYQRRTVEALKACTATFDQNSTDTIRKFQSLCHELTAARVARSQAAFKAAEEASRVYKPSPEVLSNQRWVPSDRMIESAKLAAERHRLGMSLGRACKREGLSKTTYYAAMRFLALAKD